TYAARTGLPFFCVDAATGVVLARSGRDVLPLLPADVSRRLPGLTDDCVFALPSGLLFYALPLPPIDHAATAAVGFVFARPGPMPPELVLAAAEENWPQSRLDEWAAAQPHCSAP